MSHPDQDLPGMTMYSDEISIGSVICSPWYVLVAYVWDIMGHILFSGVYIKLYIGDCLLLFFSCNHTQCRGLGTNTCLYLHYCNLIIVNRLFGPAT